MRAALPCNGAAQALLRWCPPPSRPAGAALPAQGLLAGLFAGLSKDGGGRDGGGLCVQVLAVSHNAAFQALSGHVVKVGRGPAGTAAVAGRDGDFAAALSG